jgi:hypothetical protein
METLSPAMRGQLLFSVGPVILRTAVVNLRLEWRTDLARRPPRRLSAFFGPLRLRLGSR